MSDRPIHALYDHQMFAIQRFGGISRVFVELARRLSQRPDCAVSWYRGYHIDGYDITDFQERLTRYWACQTMPAWADTRWTREQINEHGLRWFTRTIPGQVDVYHPSYTDASLIPTVRAKRVAITIHDMILERFLGDVPRFQGWLNGKRLQIEQADLIFCVSQNTKRDLLEYVPVDPARVMVAYNATSLGSVPADPLPPELQGRPFLLYVGARTRYKNFVVLQEAFARSERLRRALSVVSFGGSVPYLEPELQFQAEHGLSEQFLHLEGGDGLLRALYEHAAALVYTSRYEGFGIPPLEAMTVGCPVVCCPTSSLPEVVGDAALFFDPDQPDELVAQLETLLDDTALRHSLAERGRVQAQRFSWEKTAETTLAAYRSAL